MSDIRIDMDISSVVSKTASLLKLNDQEEESFLKTARAIQYYDEALKKTITSVTGSVDAFRKLTASFETNPSVSGGGVLGAISAKLVGMSQNAREAAKAQAELAAKMAAGEAAANSLGAAFKRVSGTLTNLALYRGFNVLIHSIQDATSNAIQFQTTVAQIQAVSRDASTTSDQWKNSIMAVSNSLGVDFKDAAGAAKEAIQSGLVSGSGVEEFTKTVAELSKVTGSSIKDSSKAVSEQMRAFGHDAGDADAVAAKLFRTTQLGNVSLQQLGSEMGRLSTQAKELGVSEDEVLSAIILLSRKGLDGGQAVQSLSTAFGKLLVPAKEAKDLLGGNSFKNIGATGGLGAILKQVDDLRAKGANVEDLFGGTRGIKGADELVRNQREFSEIRKQLGNSQAPYANAKNIVSNTDAAQLKKNIETIKNALEESIGTQLVKIITLFSSVSDAGKDATGRLNSGISNVVIGIEGLIGVVVAATVAMKALSAAQSVTALYQAAVGWGKVGQAISATAAAAKFLTPAILAGVAAWELFQRTGEKDFASKVPGLGIDEIVKKAIAEGGSDATTQGNSIDDVKRGWEDVTKQISGPLEKSLDEVNRRIEKIADSSKTVKDELQAAFAGALNPGKDKLADIRREISAIEADLRNAPERKALGDNTSQKAALSLQEGFASPQQKFQLLQQDMVDDAKKINELLANGDERSLQRARQLSEKRIQDAQKLGQIDLDYQKKSEEYRLRNDKNAARFADKDEFGNTIIAVDPTAALARINQARAEGEEIEKRIAEIEKNRLDKLKEIATAKEQELATQHKAIQEYTNFSIQDDKGNVKKDYLTPTGQFNRAKAEADYAAAKKNVQDINPTSLQDSLALANAKQKADENFKAQLGLQGQKLDITQALNKNTQQNQNQQNNLDQSKTLGNQSKDIATQAAGTINKLAEGLLRNEANIGQAKTSNLSELYERVTGQKYDYNKLPDDVRGRLIGSAQTLDQQIGKATAGAAGTVGPNGIALPDIKALREAAQTTKSQYSNYADIVAKQTGVSREQALKSNLPGTNTSSLEDAMKALDVTIKQLDSAEAKKQESLGLFGSSATELQRVQSQLSGFNGATATSTQNLKGLSDSAADASRALAGLKVLMDSLPNAGKTAGGYDTNGPQIQVTPIGGQDSISPIPNSNGWTPGGNFYGGPVYRDYGGPVGPDNIPVWASKGEMVVNAAASSKFFTQIMGMNTSSRIPQTFNTGGVVNQTNTINIHGAKSAEATGYNIHMLLQRAKRLGTVK